METKLNVLAALTAAVLMAAGAALMAADPATTSAPATTTAPALTPAQALVEKAKDLMYQGKLKDAKEANDKALALEPDLQGARLLDKILATRMAEAGVKTGTGGGETRVDKVGVLTPEQISRIRLFETGDGERALQGNIDRKTLEEFWREVVLKDPTEGVKTTADYNAFMAYNNFPGQARKIRDSRNNKFVDKVVMRSDPASMIKFRSSFHPFILNNCANTAGCHGALDAGKTDFRLLNKGGDPVTNAYTNFYVMTQTKVNGGALIDRDKPEDSLALQYLMAPAQARFAHPGKAVVPQRFTGSDDKLFGDFVNWIGTLQRPEPPYGIVFTPAVAPASK